VANLISELSKLPGIGQKTAQRLAFHLIGRPEGEVSLLAGALMEAKQKTVLCEVCCDVAESSPCAICDSDRGRDLICVVENPKDVAAIERTNEYRGRYHVLHGSISPLKNIGPGDIRIKELIGRLSDEEVKEVILATNPNIEGEATAIYISRLIKPLGVMTTRIAHGLPVGADIEYADNVTLAKSIEGRREI